MRRSSIHWKGRPHRRLPRIRTSSSRQSFTSYNLAHLAAQEVTSLPFGKPLERARRKQRCSCWGRRDRDTRESSGHPAAQRFTVEKETPSLVADHSTTSPAISKTNSSIPPRTAGDLYSLMQVPQYLSTMKVAEQTDSYQPDQISGNPIAAEYAHVGPLDGMQEPTLSKKLQLTPRRASNSGTTSVQSRRPTKSTYSNYKFSLSTRRTSVFSRRPSNKSRNLSSGAQAFWQAISSSNPWSNAIQSDASPRSNIPSRTSNQEKAFRSFVRDLKRHLLTQQALKNASISTSLTSSSSIVSARTIAEFMPYIAEFHAAGLAVTSKDQRQGIKGQPKALPQLPRPSRIDAPALGESSGTGGDGSADSPNGISLKRDSWATVSSHTSDGTVVSFTPGSEFPTPRQSVQMGLQRPVTKRSLPSLPWLRRPEKTFAQYQDVNTERAQSVHTSSAGTTIIDFSPNPNGYPAAQSNADALSSDEEPTHIQWTDVQDPLSTLSYSKYNLTQSESDLNGRQGYNDASQINRNRTSTIRLRPTADTSGQKTRNASSIHFPSEELQGSTTRQAEKPSPVDESTDELDTDYSGKAAEYVPVSISPLGAVKFSSMSARGLPRTPELHRNMKADESRVNSTHEPTHPITGSVGVDAYTVSALRPSSAPLIPACENCGAVITKYNALSKSSDMGTMRSLTLCADCPPPMRVVRLHVPDSSARGSVSRPPSHNSKDSASKDSILKLYDSYMSSNDDSRGDLDIDSAFATKEQFSQANRAKAPVSELEQRPPSQGVVRSLSDTSTPKPKLKVNDNDILRGLQIALVAACDPQIDEWIEDMSGTSVRQFLAGLRTFEGLGVKGLVHAAREASLMREQEYRRLVNLHHAARGNSSLGGQDGVDDGHHGLEEDDISNGTIESSWRQHAAAVEADIDKLLAADTLGGLERRQAQQARKLSRTFGGKARV